MICIYEPDCTDFSNNGLGVVTPMSCTVTETLNGEWELTLMHPVDVTGKWQRLVEGRILRVPVPAASTPRISMTEVEHIYRVSVKKGSLPLYSSTGKRRKLVRKYNKDTEVVVISQENADWFEVVCPDGRKGYMSAAALAFVRTDSAATDKVIEPRQLRDQPFRIYRVVPELDKITVYARHIFYDPLDNMLRKYKGLNIAASAVVQGIENECTVIVAQSITAAQIAAATITGNEIAANAIKAGNIDVANLFADEVFTAKLYTSAIYGGKSLKVWVDELSDADIHDGATPPETTGTGKKWLDRGVAPSQLRRWKGLTTTPLGNAMTTAREIEETVSGTSVSLDNSGEQINSALAVSVRGKNLLDIYALCDGISYVQGGTIGKWPENGGLDLTATANDCYTEPWNGANYNIPVKPNTTYTLSWDIYIVPNTGTSIVMYFIDHIFETSYYGQAAYDTHTLTFTTPSDAQTVSFRFGVQNSGESVGYANLQLEEGDARTAFSAYKAAATVTHNGTVYTLPLSNDADHGP